MVIEGGAKVLVTSSNRFGGGRDDRQFVTVVNAKRVTEGASAAAAATRAEVLTT